MNGVEMLALEHRQGEDDEDGQRGDLDQHQHGVEARAFLGADDQQDGDQHRR